MGTIKEHIKTIDGIEYTTKTLPAMTGLEIMARLGALLGAPLINFLFAERKDDDGNVIELELSEILDSKEAILMIVASIAKSAAVSGVDVFKDLLISTEANKVAIGDTEVPASVHTHFDTHFAGRYTHLLTVLVWVGQANFIEL